MKKFILVVVAIAAACFMSSVIAEKLVYCFDADYIKDQDWGKYEDIKRKSMDTPANCAKKERDAKTKPNGFTEAEHILFTGLNKTGSFGGITAERLIRKLKTMPHTAYGEKALADLEAFRAAVRLTPRINWNTSIFVHDAVFSRFWGSDSKDGYVAIDYAGEKYWCDEEVELRVSNNKNPALEE